MNFIQQLIGGSAKSAAQSAGEALINDPRVQSALDDSKAVAQIVTVAAVLVFVFYYVPRFKSPTGAFRS